MFMFLKEWRDPLALNIACSDIPMQLSMFSVSRCFATLTSLRKSFEEMAVLFKFNHVIFEKKRSGTFWYIFPVSAKWSCSKCCNTWAVDLRPWNTNRHHARQTDDTLTRSSGSRYSNTSGQKQSRTSVIFTTLLGARITKKKWRSMRTWLKSLRRGSDFDLRKILTSWLGVLSIEFPAGYFAKGSLFLFKDCGKLIVVKQVF